MGTGGWLPQYSLGIRNSHVPYLSSGRESKSTRRPFMSRLQKYSWGTGGTSGEKRSNRLKFYAQKREGTRNLEISRSLSNPHKLQRNFLPPSVNIIKGFM